MPLQILLKMTSEETVYGAGAAMTLSTGSLTLSTGVGSEAGAGGASGSGSASGGDPNNAVMNDKVQALAGSIYEEFETMMAKYGPEVVKNLMPLIVNVLESLDLAYTESQVRSKDIAVFIT